MPENGRRKGPALSPVVPVPYVSPAALLIQDLSYFLVHLRDTVVDRDIAVHDVFVIGIQNRIDLRNVLIIRSFQIYGLCL